MQITITQIIVIISIIIYIASIIINISIKDSHNTTGIKIEYCLDGVKYLFLMFAIFLTREECEIVYLSYLQMFLYGLVLITPIVSWFITHHSIKDIFMDIVVVVCVTPFILFDFFEFEVFSMMRDTTWTVKNYFQGSWQIEFMDVLLLAMFLAVPYVDGLYAFADQVSGTIPKKLLRTLTIIQTLIVFIGILLVVLGQVRFGKIGAYAVLLFHVFFILRCCINFTVVKGKYLLLQIFMLIFSIYSYFYTMLGIDLFNVPIVKGIGFSIVGILGYMGKVIFPVIQSAVTAYINKINTDTVLDTEIIETPLIEEIPKKRGRPVGSKDSYPRKRRTKKEIEEARAKEGK